MTELAVQRQSRSLLPELSELFKGFAPFAGLRPFFDNHAIRVERGTNGGRCEVRAELPGLHQANDIDITARDGQLTIKAERAEKTQSNGRSEFTYGSFTRSVSLPESADEDCITASYGKGILTISVPVPVPGAEPTEKHVEVQSTETDAEVVSTS